MGAVRVTLLAAVRRFGGKKAVCVARVSASRVRGRVTYFNADRTINTFVVATEAMFCADFKRGVDGPPSSSPPGSLLSTIVPLILINRQVIMNKHTDKVSYLSHSPPASRHTQYLNSVHPHSFQCLLSPPGLISTLYTTCCLNIVFY